MLLSGVAAGVWRLDSTRRRGPWFGCAGVDYVPCVMRTCVQLVQVRCMSAAGQMHLHDHESSAPQIHAACTRMDGWTGSQSGGVPCGRLAGAVGCLASSSYVSKRLYVYVNKKERGARFVGSLCACKIRGACRRCRMLGARTGLIVCRKRSRCSTPLSCVDPSCLHSVVPHALHEAHRPVLCSSTTQRSW